MDQLQISGGGSTTIVGITGTTAEFNTALTDNDFATLAGTETLTNKWVKKRVTTVASTTTSVTINYATTNMHTTTAQAGALLYNNPTGSPGEGDALLIKIQDDGTARALTWDTQFRAATGSTLPTTTTVNQYSYFAFIFNNNDTKWDYTGTQGPF